MNTFPPRHVCIAGALAIAAGVVSAVGMVADLVAGRLMFNLGFVGIPIGYGILIGRRSSRAWALFFAIVGTVGLAALGAWAVVRHSGGANRILSTEDALTAGVLLAGCVYMFGALLHKRHRKWFAAENDGPVGAESIAWAVAVVAAIFATFYYTAEWRTQKMQRELYPVRVVVHPYDPVREEGLQQLGYRGDVFSHSLHSTASMQKLNVAYRSHPQGMQLVLSGVATRAVEVTLFSEGYQDTSIVIDRQTEDDIRVPMLPVDVPKG